MCTSASSAGEPTIVTNSLGMQFIELPAGEFLRGSPGDDAEADDDERPQRLVRITRSFALGRCEVSQAEYRRVMGENPSWFSREGGGRGLVRGIDTSQHP
ncbi:MAG: SUMF1/EgtB/PvdO family nonheme iron enzyme, partial [Planctomycetes bacterium]|nr:SUMF1/EgtB/PvdO family nonheme iron enzyme [Planctomycetota bacterium]